MDTPNETFALREDCNHDFDKTEIDFNEYTLHLAREIVKQATESNILIGTAESCTGGMVGSALTSVSGASQVYCGGVISYTNRVKSDVLGVGEDTLKTYTAVSEQAAREMAVGCQRLLGVDIAVSVTGIAGPDGGSEEIPVGTVCFGVVCRDEIWSCTMHVEAHSRDYVRRESVRKSLELIYNSLISQ